MTRPDSSADDVHMLGGEMLNWSDYATPLGAFRSPCVFPLIRSLSRIRGKVLVLGPHSYVLLDAVTQLATSVSVLVRAWSDAEELKAHAGAKDITVYCGGFEKLVETAGPYDCILALDGFDRLFGTDCAPLSWSKTLEVTRGLLSDDGEVLLSVENPLGLQNLVSVGANEGLASNGRWPDSTGPSATSPRSVEDAHNAMRSVGLERITTRGAFPSGRSPTLIVTEATLDEFRGDDRLSTLISRAFNHHVQEDEPFKDPRSLARTVVQSGMGLQMAASWVFHARAGAEIPSGDASEPAVIFAESVEDDYWGVAYTVDPFPSGRWARTPLQDERTSAPRQVGYLRRSIERLAEPVPPGILVEELLVAACAVHDLPEIRTLLRRYFNWLVEGSVTQPWTSPWVATRLESRRIVHEDHVFAEFDNVALSHGTFGLVDPSWTASVPVPIEVAFVRVLRRFAQRLISGGHEHPWPFGSSPDRIAASMAAMVGFVVDEATRHQSAALAAEVDGPPSAWFEHDVVAGAEYAAEMSSKPMGNRDIVGLAESHAAVARLTDQLAETTMQVDWLINKVQQKDRHLRRAGREMAQLQATRTYRLVQLLTWPVRLWKQVRSRGSVPEHVWRPPRAKPEINPDLLPPGRRGPGNDGGAA